LESARDYAQVVSLETGFAIHELVDELNISTIYHKRLFQSDKRALKKPISTEPMASMFSNAKK